MAAVESEACHALCKKTADRYEIRIRPVTSAAGISHQSGLAAERTKQLAIEWRCVTSVSIGHAASAFICLTSRRNGLAPELAEAPVVIERAAAAHHRQSRAIPESSHRLRTGSFPRFRPSTYEHLPPFLQMFTPTSGLQSGPYWQYLPENPGRHAHWN